MTIKLTTLTAVINQLADAMTDPVQINRLTRGVLYTQVIEPTTMDQPTFNKVIIPIFTRTVYSRHGMDVPVIPYINSLIEFVDESDVVFKDLQVDQAKGIDEEADVMEKLADEFMAGFDIPQTA